MGRRGNRKRHHDNQISNEEWPSTMELTQQDKADLDQLLNKCFTYDPDESWILPSTDQLFTADPWQDSNLCNLKEELNRVKNLLSELEIESWHRHTCWTHRAGLVTAHLRTTVRPELCTQAWSKFQEILGHFDLLNECIHGGQIFSVHICEAPGAFITCLNHTLQSLDRTPKWTWLATTLNPYYEGNNTSDMIDDDRFIMNTLEHWHFGADDTGNVMNTENLTSLQQRINSWPTVNLVTADGSIDCANQPAHQEESVSRLLLSEVITAVAILSPGGALVLKTFTQLEASSIGLLYLLNCVFKKVSVFKPSTSKPGNSEVYVACRGYKGISQDLLQVLTTVIDSKKNLPPLLSDKQIPETFLQQHRKCCHTVVGWQSSTIKENLSLYQEPDSDTRLRIDSLRQHFIEMFMNKFCVRPIDNSQRIVPYISANKQRKSSDVTSNSSHKRHTGTYVARQQELQLPWKSKLLQLQKLDLTSYAPCVHWLPTEETDLGHTDVEWCKKHFGRFPDTLHNSVFTDHHLLHIYTQLLTQGQNIENPSLESTRFKPCFEEILSQLAPEKEETLNVVNVHDSDGAFSKFLKEQKHRKIQHTSIQCSDQGDTILPPGVAAQRLILVESTGNSPKEMGVILSSTLLKNLHSSLKALQPDDHLMVYSSPLLTRRTVGSLFLIRKLFRQVGVCVCQNGGSPFLCCVGMSFVPPCDKLAKHLHHCYDLVEDEGSRSPKSSLLSLLHIQLLLEPTFYNSIFGINEDFLKRRIKYLLKHELKTLEGSTS